MLIVGIEAVELNVLHKENYYLLNFMFDGLFICFVSWFVVINCLLSAKISYLFC